MRNMLIVSAALAMLIGSAQASVITVSTTAGAAMDGLPVNVQVTFTTSQDQILVTLQNLQVDPKSVIQNLSGLLFSIDTSFGSASLADSWGVERTLASNGQYTVGGTVSTGWALSATGGGLLLNVLGTPVGPEHTLVGSPGANNLYDNLNGSMASGAHNPFLGELALFTITAAGVTDDTRITDAKLLFGTTAGREMTVSVPEPMTMAMVLAGSMLVVWKRRRTA